MSTDEKLLTSAQAREKHRKWLANRTVRPAGIWVDVDLAKPKIPDFFPGEPDFEGWVPLVDQNVDMRILIPIWDNGANRPDRVDRIIIEWKKSTDVDWVEIDRIPKPGPTMVGDPDYEWSLPKINFSEHGTYSLRYQILAWNSVQRSSFSQDIIVDKKKPHYDGLSPDPLKFFHPEVADDGVTQKYLDDNDNFLPMVVPIYDDEKPGDRIQAFIYGETPDPEGTPVYFDPYEAGRVVKIPGERITVLPDGLLHINYRLFDKVGNHGDYALPAVTDLAIQPFPVPPLAIPEIPLAQDAETLIDLEDLRRGVHVKIKRYLNWSSRDFLEINWDEKAYLPPYPVGPFPPEDILVPMNNQFLLDAYGTSTTGNKPTVVKYDVLRGKRRFHSLEAPILVNFATPGQPNPDKPNPVNPTYLEVTVKGGGANPVDNVLRVEDRELDATAEVTIYTPFLAGERMWLYWGSLPGPVAIYDPDPANPPPSGIVTFTVKWEDIEKEPGSMDVKVHYKVGYIAGGNSEYSKPQFVDVSAAIPIKLGTPTFPDHQLTEPPESAPILNCHSFIGPDQHVRVRFPGNNPLVVGGESVTLTFQGYSDEDGTVAAGTPWIRTFNLTEAEARDGFERLVEPFADHIEPVGPYGSVRVTYVATTAGGDIPGEAHIFASSTDSAGTCPINP